MGYRLKRSESLAVGLRRIAREQLRAAIAELRHAGSDTATAVHSARKRFKKLRGLLRLARPGLGEQYAAENAWFRDRGRELSPLRDAEALASALTKLADGHESPERAARIRACAARFRLHRSVLIPGEQDAGRVLAELADRLELKLVDVDDWSISGRDRDVVAKGFAKTYRQARRALRAAAADPTDSNLHEWRKRVKDHWDQLRLLKQALPGEWRSCIAVSETLSDVLGDDHDLAMLTERLRVLPPEWETDDTLVVVSSLISDRRESLRQQAFSLGTPLFEDKAGKVRKRVRRWWKRWK